MGGAALYVGSLLGPGILLVPALAVRAAGPASIISWGFLLLLSAPLAVTFGALGVRLPVVGGVAAYVRDAFVPTWGSVTGIWFIFGVLLGAPTVSVIGGNYVADLTGGGRLSADIVACAVFSVALAANARGLRATLGVQLVSAGVLSGLIVTAVASALPHQTAASWHPFAPHGLSAIGSAASVLVLSFIGWEAVAQYAASFRQLWCF